jgi:glutamyl/glutaminyl-tRNA synthetase
MSVHVRFAPSPTGSLHLGSALTALVNRLFASKAGGTMLLRIDDTDAERTVAGAEDAILADLRWLGIGWDEGPVRQSSRAERHVEAANLAEHTTIRDGALFLSPPGVRPFVIVRGDGRPTYHWATVVDDLDFGITHVIRGGDHRANEDLHAAGFRALGAEPPVFIHHAIVLGVDGKLSKREGDASVADLRAAGYLPQAVVNMLGLVASSGPGEVLDMDELVARFEPDRIARGDVRLDPARLRSLAALHLARLGNAELVAAVLPFCRPGTPPAAVEAMAPALRGAHTLAEAAELVACVLDTPGERAATLPELAELRRDLPEQLDEMQARELVDELRRRGIPLRNARLALTGRTNGPELWAVLAALPRDEAVRRAA